MYRKKQIFEYQRSLNRHYQIRIGVGDILVKMSKQKEKKRNKKRGLEKDAMLLKE